MNCEATSHIRRAAVIGGGLGGLSTAIHLCLKGFEVTIYEANKSVGGRANRITFNGFAFDTGPTLLNYPWVFEQLFNSAGSRLYDYVELLLVDPSMRFFWPQGESLWLTSNLTRLVSELEHMEPGSGPGLFEFLADASEKYRIAFDKLVCRNADHPLQWFGSLSLRDLFKTGVWRSLDRELSRFFSNRLIRDALGSYGMYLGGSPQRLPGIFSILSYGELAMGLWLPRGGIYALVQAIEGLAHRLGVRILTEQRVEQIVIRNGKTVGVTLSDGRTDTWPIVVSNVDVPSTLRYLIKNNKNRPPKTLKMTPSVMTFYWAVRGKIRGAGHHTIFMPHDPARAYDQLITRHEVPRELPFYMNIASETDATLAPPADSSVFVLVPLPKPSHLNQGNWLPLQEKLKQRIFQRIDRHGMRFSAGDIVFERVMTPTDWEKQFGLFEGSAFGAAHTLFQMGTFRYPNRDRHIKGLYYTGASTTPGTGLPMVVLSGKMTAERICMDVC